MPKFNWKRGDRHTLQRKPLIKYQVSYDNDVIESCDMYTTSVNAGNTRSYRSVIKWESQLKAGGFELFWSK